MNTMCKYGGKENGMHEASLIYCKKVEVLRVLKSVYINRQVDINGHMRDFGFNFALLSPVLTQFERLAPVV